MNAKKLEQYSTLVKGNHPVYGNNEYVVGVIMGIMSVVTDHIGSTGPILVDAETGNHILRVRTTAELYGVFERFVERKYPGLCEFNYNYGYETE